MVEQVSILQYIEDPTLEKLDIPEGSCRYGESMQQQQIREGRGSREELLRTDHSTHSPCALRDLCKAVWIFSLFLIIQLCFKLEII